MLQTPSTAPDRTTSSVFLFLIAFAVYLNALPNEFAFDGVILVRDNPQIRSLHRSLQSFFQPTFPGDLYRPITILSYGLSYFFVGISPFTYHLWNLIFHGLVCVLAFHFVRAFIREEAALLACLLYAIHPIHSEVVAGIVGRAEMLAAIGVLAALNVFIYSKRSITVFVIGLCFLFGLLAKESAATLFLLLPAAYWCLPEHRKPEPAVLRNSVLVLVGVFAIYLWLRSSALGANAYAATRTHFLDNPLITLGTVSRICFSYALLGLYATLHLVPMQLRADYSYPQIELVWNPSMLNGLIVSLLLSCGALYAIGKKDRRAFFALWYFLAFAITSNVLFPIGTIFAERLSYMPGLGLMALLAVFLTQLRSVFLRRALFVAIGSFYFAMTIVQSPKWKNNQTLHASQVQASPFSAKAQLNYALALKEQGNLDAASLHVLRALELYPEYAHAAWARAEIYADKNVSKGAERWYHRALEMEADHVESYAGLGRLELQRRHNEKAGEYFSKALEINPGHFESQVGMLAVTINRGELEKARDMRDRLIAWDAQHKELQRVSSILDGLLGG